MIFKSFFFLFHFYFKQVERVLVYIEYALYIRRLVILFLPIKNTKCIVKTLSIKGRLKSSYRLIFLQNSKTRFRTQKLFVFRPFEHSLRSWSVALKHPIGNLANHRQMPFYIFQQFQELVFWMLDPNMIFFFTFLLTFYFYNVYFLRFALFTDVSPNCTLYKININFLNCIYIRIK